MVNYSDGFLNIEPTLIPRIFLLHVTRCNLLIFCWRFLCQVLWEILACTFLILLRISLLFSKMTWWALGSESWVHAPYTTGHAWEHWNVCYPIIGAGMGCRLMQVTAVVKMQVEVGLCPSWNIFPRIEHNKSKYSKIDYQKHRTVRILWIYF